MTKLLKILCLIAVVVFGVSLTATAQSTSAQLTGKITDASGAVVPHARVTAKNTGTNLTKTAESNDVGVYSLVSLPPGEYSLTTEAQGFATRIQTGIVLTVAQAATLDIALQVGGTQDTVTVNGGAELINTTTAEISQVIGEDSIKDLPLNGRDPSSLVNLSVGVTNELVSQASTLPGSNSFPLESGASAGGQRQGSTWYLLDGVANMDTFALLAAPFPNADATQEFRVISNNFDARYGFAPSAVVSIQTKSGTNQFHGGAFEFIRNNDLNASNWFSGAVDPLKRNQFGGYVGGPIFKDKLFFFTNYQGTRSSYQASTNSTYTPTQAMLNGDFSAVPAGDLDGPLAGVFHTVNGKPNQVDPKLFSPGALAIAKSLPLGQAPSTGLTNYGSPAQKFTYNENTTRFDYTINPNQRVFLRSFTYLYNQPGASIPGDILAGVNGQDGTYLNLVAGHTWTVTPTLLNSATLSWAEIDFSTGTIEKDAGGSPICLSRYINVSDPVGQCYIGGLSAFDGNVLYGGGLGFNAFTGNPNDTRRRYWWFTDTATKTIGKHTLTFGTDIMHRYGFEFYGGSVNPNVSFNGQFTGFPLSDFLLGYLSSMSQGAGESGSESGYMIGLYAQDQFKLLSNLTLTAGLRWDPNFPLQVAGGRGAAFVPGQQSTRYPNAPLGLVFPGDHGINNGLMPTTYGYFEPRIGLAWQVHPDTVVRAGFGLFTTPLEDAFYNHVWDTAPFAPSYGLNGGATTPLSFDNPWSGFTSTGGKSPFPPFASPSQLPPSNAAFITPLAVPAVFSSNFKLGITQSWNLSLEQSFGKQFVLHMAYVGSESFHQATTVDQNPGGFVCPPGVPANPNTCNDVRSTYTNFAQIIQVQPAATSSYNALQVGVEKRFSHGLQFQSNFTWSHDTDVGGSGDPSFESSVSDPHNVGHDYGPSSLNYPVVSVSNLVYRFPLLAHKNALIKNTLGGWEISGLYTAQSGPPFTINGGQGNNNSGFLVGQDRADVVPGQPLQVRQGGKSHWVNQYLNPAAFTNNAYGTAGNSKKFSVQEAPISTADLAVIKNWSIYDRYKIQFRWEAFNALNHPSFGQPDSNPGDSNFGQITSIGSVAPRVMQGGLKFSF
ncbi:TonB-dependent receptor [Edaphobacter dinghuensis]|uniref:Oar protein n=1 Tax=Edaphobacter dinghuensis TaxID=1560005 RepID=A0A917HP02_9BACT|nr:carboxypeptidase regulatory-like domain-containing protein [Edaphobacter dinghuensis]GGG85855.1 Oar protein [Edaphobacter dinghuensis]